ADRPVEQGLSLGVEPHDLEEELLFRAEVPDDEGRIDARLRGNVAYRGARVPPHREERGCGFADRLPAGVPSRSHAATLRCDARTVRRARLGGTHVKPLDARAAEEHTRHMGTNASGNQSGGSAETYDVVNSGQSDDIENSLTGQGTSDRETLSDIVEAEGDTPVPPADEPA